MSTSDENILLLNKWLFIGVSDFSTTLQVCCPLLEHCILELCFSFELDGDFLPAAFSDDISQTVDYDALSKLLEKKIIDFDCSTIEHKNAELGAVILAFSPLIKGGSFTLKGKRHNAFFEATYLF